MRRKRAALKSMPLNPKIEQVLEMIAKAKRPAYHELTPQQARASYEKSAPILEIPGAPDYSMSWKQVPGETPTSCENLRRTGTMIPGRSGFSFECPVAPIGRRTSVASVSLW